MGPIVLLGGASTVAAEPLAHVPVGQDLRDALALLHGELSVLQSELSVADAAQRDELFATRWEELRAATEELSLELELADAGLLGARLWITRLDYAGGSPEERLGWLDVADELAQLSGVLETRLKIVHLRATWMRGQGEIDAACALLDEALGIEGADAAATTAYLLHLFAELELLAARPIAALGRLDAARERLAEGAAGAALGRALDGTRGQAFLELGLIDRASPWITGAWERVQRSLERGVDVGRDERVATRLRRLNLRLAQGRFAGVARESAQALEEDPAFAARDTWRAVLLLTRAEALLRSGSDLPAAREALRDARAELAEPLVHQRAVLLSVSVALAEGDLAAARELLARDDVPASGAAARQLDASRLALAAELALEEGAAPERLRALRDALEVVVDERLEVWRAAPRLPGGVGFLAVPARRDWLSVLAMLDVALEGEQGAERAFLRWLRCFEAAGGTRATNDWRALLGARAASTVVSWLPASRRTLLWLATRDGVRTEVLAHEGELERAAERLTRTLETNAAAASEAALALGRVLGGSASDLLADAPSWTLLGRELIERVPLELVRLRADGPPVGTTHAIAHWTSFADAAQWRARPQASARSDRYTFALVAAPVLDPSLRERFPEAVPLDFGDRERATLLSAWDDGEAVVHEGPAADYAALQGSLREGARVLQIVAHGVLEDGDERPGRLLLAGSPVSAGLAGSASSARLEVPDPGIGLVDAPALEQLALQGPELALVTTCHSGAGPRRPGQALAASLAGALLSARTRCVLATTRTIGYGATLELSARFHAALRAGASPAEALRVARAERFAERGLRGLVESLPLQLWGLGHEPLFATEEDRRVETASSGQSGGPGDTRDARGPGGTRGMRDPGPQEQADGSSTKRTAAVLGAAVLAALGLFGLGRRRRS